MPQPGSAEREERPSDVRFLTIGQGRLQARSRRAWSCSTGGYELVLCLCFEVASVVALTHLTLRAGRCSFCPCFNRAGMMIIRSVGPDKRPAVPAARLDTSRAVGSTSRNRKADPPLGCAGRVGRGLEPALSALGRDGRSAVTLRAPVGPSTRSHPPAKKFSSGRASTRLLPEHTEKAQRSGWRNRTAVRVSGYETGRAKETEAAIRPGLHPIELVLVADAVWLNRSRVDRPLSPWT